MACKSKLLPSHKKIDYYECLAKIVLEEIFPNEFISLDLKDKPDLQNRKSQIGIEVTRANNPRQEENESLYVKILNNEIRNKEKAIKKINSSYEPHSMIINGQEVKEPDRYHNGILVGISENDSFNRIFEAFKNKLEKLNGYGYERFQYNYLFVYSEILANEKMINEIIFNMNTAQENCSIKFCQVFVYVPSYLYILNLKDNIGEIKCIREIQDNLHKQAFEKVKENNYYHENDTNG